MAPKRLVRRFRCDRRTSRSCHLLLPCCLLAISALAGGFLHAQSAARPDPYATPFGFMMPAAKAAEPAKFLTYLPQWLRAIERHQIGAFDEPATLVSGWTLEELASVVRAWEIERGSPLPQRFRTAKRAIILHTDVATSTFDTVPDALTMARTASLHFGVAFELIEWLKHQNDDEDEFARSWYKTVAAFLGSRHELTSSPVFMQRGVSRFPGDADLLLMAGAIHELLAAPRVQEASDTRLINKASASAHLATAERFFRQALAADPSLAEARVRLGRVLGERGRHAEALGELKQAAAGRLPPALAYFVHLFAGEDEGALNRADEARACYERAIVLRPDAYFAYLALTRLERQNGNRRAAAAATQRMLHAARGDIEASDLWMDYHTAGIARRADEALREFRRAHGSRQ